MSDAPRAVSICPPLSGRTKCQLRARLLGLPTDGASPIVQSLYPGKGCVGKRISAGAADSTRAGLSWAVHSSFVCE
jgi:hypothetical protein